MSATRTNGNNKRIRESDSSSDTQSFVAPTAAADCAIRLAAASLHKSITPVAIDYAQQIIKLVNTRSKLSAATEALKSTDKIPQAVRVKFTLGGSAKIRSTDGFIALATKAQSITAQYQADMKAIIVAQKELELETIQRAIKIEIVKSVCLLAKLATVAAPAVKSSNSANYEFVANCLSSASFARFYDMDEIGAIINQTLSVSAVTGTFTLLDPPAFAAHSAIHAFCKSMQDLFIGSINAYTAQDDANKLAQKLTSMALLDSTERTTSDVAMQLDDEPPCPPETVQAMIDSKVIAATKGLNAKILALEKALKNKARGATDSASLKKKKKTNTPPLLNSTETTKGIKKKQGSGMVNNKDQKKGKGKEKAAAANNDSKSVNKTASANKSNKKKKDTDNKKKA
jgi:hypothetical protein